MSKRPLSSPEHVTKCLLDIAKVLKRKGKTEDELREEIANYVEILIAYPPQAVAYACDRWRTHKGRWPLVSDLVTLIEDVTKQQKAREPVPVSGSQVRNEAISLLGTYYPTAKTLLPDDGDLRNFVAEAARIWGKVRPPAGLEEIDKTRGARCLYGYALEAWARDRIGDEPIHVAFACAAMAEVYGRMTGSDLLTRGELPDPAGRPGLYAAKSL